MLLLFRFLITCLCFFTFNISGSGFSTTAVDEELKERFTANIDLKLTDEPATSTIQCFDVNEEGVIALGHTPGSSLGVISVYSSDGTFKYGYEFGCSGLFGVEWDKEILNIYFVRSDLLVSVTSSGEITNISEVENTIENNSYYNNFISATNRNVNNMDYEMRNIFLSSYSQLVLKDGNGKEMVLYNAQTSQLAQIGIVIIGAIIFVVVLLIAGFYHKENIESDTAKK